LKGWGYKMGERVYRGVPALETDRLIIRAISMDDTEFLHKHMNDKNVRRFFDKTWPVAIEGVTKFLKEAVDRNESDQAAEWVIVLKNEGKVIGRIWFGILYPWCKGLNVGYSLDYEYWGKGIASEALKRVIEFGFDEMNLRRIEAWHDSENIDSGKVMLKCDMQFEGTLRERSSNGNAEMYSIIRQDFYIKRTSG